MLRTAIEKLALDGTGLGIPKDKVKEYWPTSTPRVEAIKQEKAFIAMLKQEEVELMPDSAAPYRKVKVSIFQQVKVLAQAHDAAMRLSIGTCFG